MILRKDDPLVEWLRSREPYMTLDDNPTAENIARAIYDHVGRGIPGGVGAVVGDGPSHATYRG